MRKLITINNQLIGIKEEGNATFVNVYVEPKKGYDFGTFGTTVETMNETYGNLEAFIKCVLKMEGVKKIKRVIID